MGSLMGTEEGVPVGSIDGREEGRPDGRDVGSLEGREDGEEEGSDVGSPEGCDDGSKTVPETSYTCREMARSIQHQNVLMTRYIVCRYCSSSRVV